MKPLFIPLKADYFNAFAAGTKTYEIRPYGKRWNENTCREGRAVTLSYGYGKQRRLSGRISTFAKQNATELAPADRLAVLACYGTIDMPVALIAVKGLSWLSTGSPVCVGGCE